MPPQQRGTPRGDSSALPPATSVEATWFLATGGPVASPIAIIELRGDVERALGAIGTSPVEPGTVGLRDLAGVDRGLVARWTESWAQLMPHGGVEVVRRVLRALEQSGVEHAEASEPRERYPEAGSLIEARVLEGLARAASPLAVDLLLDQARLWSETDAESDPARDRVLRRLIDPPLVVATGPANVGKSSLVNALARESVAIVSSEPGTTRDHVGALIDLAGLVVRYVDTPGIREQAAPGEREACRLAQRVRGSAELILRCGDAFSPPPEAGSSGPREQRSEDGAEVLTVALRTDLGAPAFACDAWVSVAEDRGVGELATMIRDRLVPPGVLVARTPWRFWAEA